MPYPIGNWPVSHSVPAMFSCTLENAEDTVKQLVHKLHNVKMYNLLQVARGILKEEDHELRSVCTPVEFKLLQAYAYACTIKIGMTIKVTWKSDEEGQPDSTHNCKVASECTEGRLITVECEDDNGLYDICLYLDEVEPNKHELLVQFTKDFPDAEVNKVFMVDVESKAFYFGQFTQEGKLDGDCRVEGFDGRVIECKYSNGLLVQ